LLIAGLQVPVIPLSDVVGNSGIEAPEQKGPTVVNVGVVLELMAMVSVVVVAHKPAVGVNV
jgi:hypothetical protein